MRVAVIGYGVEGRAAVEYWRRSAEVTVCVPALDRALPDGVAAHVGVDYLTGLDEFNVLVRSPGVHPAKLSAALSSSASGPVHVTSVVNEFMTRCPAPVIGVTGTQGKGTTCTAIAAILRAAGRRVFLGGNIGIPPLQFLGELTADDLVVLELSNMQLIDLDRSPQVAVVLPVTPDHLNYHVDLDEYYASKTSITAHQGQDDVVVFAANNEVAAKIALASPGRHIPVGEPSGVQVSATGIVVEGIDAVSSADVRLRGKHNLENLAAAVGAAYDLVHGDLGVVRAGVRGLEPLPHRLSPVAEVDGVLYVNDSLSTTPQTACAAMAAFPEPKVLILGGSSKGVEFDVLARSVATTAIRALLLVGQDGPRIAAALDAAGSVGHEFVHGDTADVVRRAAGLARPGDVVLLSPACASFGQFRDYADRGDQFAAAVHDLSTAEKADRWPTH